MTPTLAIIVIVAAAAISAQSLFWGFFWVIIAALVYFLLKWLLGEIGLPEPFAKIANAIIAILVVVCLLNAVFTIVGKPFISW